MEIQESDLWVPVGSGGDRLYIRRLQGSVNGEAVLMVHGVMANGRIFYTDSGKGLAPFLARAGFDVYVADLRGRGRSTPKIDRQARHGQTEIIREDIPALFEAIRRERGEVPVHCLAHSWGGVHMTSSLLWQPALIERVKSCVWFGSKRSIRVFNLNKLFEVDLLWNRIARWVIRRYGYLPATRMRLGADDETDRSHYQSMQWAKPLPWVDDDGFNYANAARRHPLPPTLYFAAQNDPCRGHPHDVARFRDECAAPLGVVHRLGRATGHRHDYDHVSLLTHPDAPDDHFPLVLDWLAGRYETVAERR
ncbi:alpha/beta fold hydrolase [Crenobacter sp. SG2303]|uniref:Alpha/beta fold hydrolase n=1 Tax=Crenobacter oryzisoli TaxID=3056844 RepID=A0ABT7XJJ6_9NEIS|nr:alpha/beta fold hydrolase [Crenobacter sp. SG2303]MDN0073948.1 alpha/beta fold hydrolase [Crenobacter sp. SG2303]